MNGKVRSVAVYGGVSKYSQISRLRTGVEIVIACPGRLLDLVGDGEIDLSQVEVLVLDEADRMCDMGFLPDIRRILKLLPERRQTLFFSATMPQRYSKAGRQHSQRSGHGSDRENCPSEDCFTRDLSRACKSQKEPSASSA